MSGRHSEARSGQKWSPALALLVAWTPSGSSGKSHQLRGLRFSGNALDPQSHDLMCRLSFLAQKEGESTHL